MKKTILFLAVIFIFRITGFGQTNEEVIKTSESKYIQEYGSINSSISNGDERIIYYFTNIHDYSSVFKQDTLVALKTPVNDNPPKLLLTNDSKFIFVYTVDFKIIKKRNDQTGELMDFGVDNSKRIHGNWKSNDIHNAMTFILSDQSTVNYAIKEEDKLIYFIKVN